MIEAVSETNIDDVLPLIRSYQAFYNVADISDERNWEFFSQFGESNPSGCQFLYRENSIATSFATVYFSYASSITAKVAILNDLYVAPGSRGQGIAKQLIEHCRSFAVKQGATRLQWVTAEDNLAAQKLYESLNTNKSTWHFYTYPVNST